MSSLSQFPISPPVFQNGRYIPTKSPHLRSLSAVLKSSRPMEYVRSMWNLDPSSLYSSWFHRMSSPRWRIVGLLLGADDGDCGEG